MSLITIMGDIPLYSTVEEAEAWGSTFGIQGYHTHVFQGQTGYMAGRTHGDIELTLESFNLSAGDYAGNYMNTGTGVTGGGGNDVETRTEAQTQTNTLQLPSQPRRPRQAQTLGEQPAQPAVYVSSIN